jgi:hypothetical protein
LHVLLFVVARAHLDRYEALRREFEDWRGVRIGNPMKRLLA